MCRKNFGGIQVSTLMSETRRNNKKEDVTTFKVKTDIAAILGQIAELRGVMKQDVLDDYRVQFEDELSRLLTKRQAELQRKRKAGP